MSIFLHGKWWWVWTVFLISFFFASLEVDSYVVGLSYYVLVWRERGSYKELSLLFMDIMEIHEMLFGHSSLILFLSFLFIVRSALNLHPFGCGSLFHRRIVKKGMELELPPQSFMQMSSRRDYVPWGSGFSWMKMRSFLVLIIKWLFCQLLLFHFLLFEPTDTDSFQLNLVRKCQSFLL
jgi:hypothetical protein